MKYHLHRTAAAIATPPGEGGIAVIRISGSKALAVADHVFSGPVRSYKTHTAHLGKIYDKQDEFVDEVVILIMKGSRSFTGEDTVEIQCHGGSLITKRVLQTILDAGAEHALPGEFCYKAFMNGKIDLTQAEAIQSFISSKNDLALQASREQLQGGLAKRIQAFQQSLVDLTAIVEAWVDYPEEGLEFISNEQFTQQLTSLLEAIHTLESTFEDGKKFTSELKLCLIGAPNAGKSSLLNAMIDFERAIVTNIPGTTRDIIEESIQFAGLAFKIIDTAGIRNTDDTIEKEGIRRSYYAAEQADLILHVIDATDPQPITPLPLGKTITIWNKIDLPHRAPQDFPGLILTSAATRQGLDDLKSAIRSTLFQHIPDKQEVVLTQQRHHDALKQARMSLCHAKNHLTSGTSPEIISIDMKEALHHLGTIIGMDVTENILDSIFTHFCVGK